MTTWSENVRRARAERGMRQQDVAAAAGISISAVCLVERGYESTPRTRSRIAAALDRRPSELFPTVNEGKSTDEATRESAEGGGRPREKK